MDRYPKSIGSKTGTLEGQIRYEDKNIKDDKIVTPPSSCKMEIVPKS